MRIHAAHLSGKPDGPVALLVPTTKQYPEHLRGGMVALDTVPGYDPRVSAPHPDWVAASQPCPTCGGPEAVCGICMGAQGAWNKDGPHDRWDGCWRCSESGRRHTYCLDCIGGFPKVELTYPCPFPHEDLGCVRLPSCDDGLVSAGVGTLTLVKLIADGKGVVPQDGEAIIRADGKQMLHQGRRIVLPSGVKPSDTVAIWTAAEEPTDD